MQSYHLVHLRLEKRDRQQLAAMLTKRRESARVLRRASMLHQLDRGQKAAQVAASVGVAAKTVRAVARRYEEQGLEFALHEKPRPDKERALDVGQSERIIAMVCGSPPKRVARWSVRLIASEAVKRKLAPQVNQAEIEISLFSRQCLGRQRSPSLERLQRQARAEPEDEPRRRHHQLAVHAHKSTQEVRL